MVEIWRNIEGYEGIYQVSNLGRVKSNDRYVRSRSGFRRYKGKIHSSIVLPSGYTQTTVNHKSYSVHRLVCSVFHENKENKPTVNHIDGNKQNNRADNLEWVTYKENSQHASANGLYNVKKGELHHSSKVSNELAKYLYVFLKGRKITNQIINEYDLSRATLRRIKHALGGFKWLENPL